MLFWLIVAHFLCDYPLQGNYLAMAKNRFVLNDDGSRKWLEWKWALGGHAAIHGGAVALITGIWWLGVLEAISHFVIDDLKCAEKLSYNQDQFLHLLCKVLWVLILVVIYRG